MLGSRYLDKRSRISKSAAVRSSSALPRASRGACRKLRRRDYALRTRRTVLPRSCVRWSCRRGGAGERWALPIYSPNRATSLSIRRWRNAILKKDFPGIGAACRRSDRGHALGMVFRSRVYWLMPTFEAGDWARFSVGGLLMKSLVEWSISRGLSRFDLTIGDEAYKRLWADHSMPLYEYIRGMTTKGRLFCGSGRQASKSRIGPCRTRESGDGPGCGGAVRSSNSFARTAVAQAIAAHSRITVAHDVRRDARTSEREQWPACSR